MKRLLVLLLGLAFSPLLYAGELDLTIPDSPAKTGKNPGDDTACKGCGVITNIRQLARAVDQIPASPEPYLITFGEATREPGGEVNLSGARIETRDDFPGGPWQTTVRYDDGSYAAFQQDAQPTLHEGDQVQVISGKPVLR